MNPFVHVFAGLVLARMFQLDSEWTAGASVLPDLDAAFRFLFPFTARGILHSAAGAFLISGMILVLGERRKSFSVFLGMVSHLVLDLVAGPKIPLLFPLEGYFGMALGGENELLINFGFLSIFAMFLLAWNRFSITRMLGDPG